MFFCCYGLLVVKTLEIQVLFILQKQQRAQILDISAVLYDSQ